MTTKLSIGYAECPAAQYEPFERDLLAKFGILDRQAAPGVLRSVVLDVAPDRLDEVEAVARAHGVNVTSVKAVARSIN